jgi:hypothetical protein
MIKYSIILIIVFSGILFSQNNTKDSIYSGRKCIVVLFNGFESEGTIISVTADTIIFVNEYSEYKIARNQIKSVNRWKEAEEEIFIEQAADTSHYCDVYLDGGIKMTDVKLVKDTDSTIRILKIHRLKTYNIAAIRKIVFTSEGFGKGFLYGAGIGAALGTIVVFSLGGFYMEAAGYFVLYLAGIAASSGLIGGIIGAASTKDDIYIFDKGFTKVKSKKINFIIEKHKQ